MNHSHPRYLGAVVAHADFGLVALLALAACSSLTPSQRGDLLDAASVDHNCPRDQIEITAELDDPELGRRYELEICGRTRKYVRDGDIFVDSTTRAKARDRRDAHKRELERDTEVDHAPPE